MSREDCVFSDRFFKNALCASSCSDNDLYKLEVGSKRCVERDCNELAKKNICKRASTRCQWKLKKCRNTKKIVFDTQAQVILAFVLVGVAGLVVIAIVIVCAVRMCRGRLPGEDEIPNT